MTRAGLGRSGHAWLAMAAFWLGAQQAAGQPVPPAEDGAKLRPLEVESDGVGISREAAIDRALANALAQQGGTDVAAASAEAALDLHGSAMRHGTQAPNVSFSGMRTAALRDGDATGLAAGSTHQAAAASAVFATSAGRVLHYRVLSVQTAPGGGFLARVHAVLDIYQRDAGPADRRKRIAIGGFDGPQAGASGQALYDRLVIALTQSRRFVVLDRADTTDFAREAALVRSDDAAPSERARAGQALGADLLLVGKLQTTAAHSTGAAAHTDSETIELTGEVITHTTPGTLHVVPGHVSAEFELIDVATRQIVVADRSTIGLAQAGELAPRIAALLVNTIYPPMLISADDPADLIVNEGGNLIHTGERFRLMAQGAELFDPYTHESLGRTERLAGLVEILDVGPRMSHARLVSGALPAAGAGGILREPAAPPPADITRETAGHRARVAHKAVASLPAASTTEEGVHLPFNR